MGKFLELNNQVEGIYQNHNYDFPLLTFLTYSQVSRKVMDRVLSGIITLSRYGIKDSNEK